MRFNLFDKICGVMAIILGAIFVLLGALGTIIGCKANFTLPPILGGIPLLIGWGIIKAVLVAWKVDSPDSSSPEGSPECKVWE